MAMTLMTLESGRMSDSFSMSNLVRAFFDYIVIAVS
jgi:hypothetical protein